MQINHHRQRGEGNRHKQEKHLTQEALELAKDAKKANTARINHEEREVHGVYKVFLIWGHSFKNAPDIFNSPGDIASKMHRTPLILPDTFNSPPPLILPSFMVYKPSKHRASQK